ncbi:MULTISPECIES: FAD synthetase family protein [Bacillaceae]|uniref:FAD synthase n=1 Tax=Peribacillus huizhouensis TaxID=1501239 RepID=A0ABR6CQD0_9BACI|nr:MULTISPECIES: FAD synthetase family protein [Bacillaceae]MBA9027144.1 riboflavin kinase/FMN adenylyltransferase [Peribacillus huizhouensis]
MDVIYVNKSNRHLFLSESEPSVIALGFFDGVHLGHRQVINEAIRIADEKKLQLACMSFFPHPKEVLKRDKKKIQYLMPMNTKQRILKKLGVQKFYIVQFDQDFASLTPKQFVQKYLLEFGVKYAVAGFDFTYGQFGEGNMDRIKTDSNNSIEGVKVNKVDINGEKISSTLIRKLISTGKMDIVHRYLGEHYQIKGQVYSNTKTVEVVPSPYYLLPPPGVYEVTVSKGNESDDQVVLITQDATKIIFPAHNKRILVNQEEIHISWKKRLSPGLFTILEKQPKHNVMNKPVFTSGLL